MKYEKLFSQLLLFLIWMVLIFLLFEGSVFAGDPLKGRNIRFNGDDWNYPCSGYHSEDMQIPLSANLVIIPSFFNTLFSTKLFIKKDLSYSLNPQKINEEKAHDRNTDNR